VLQRIRYEHGNRGLAQVIIAYLHRGAPDDVAYLRGEDVVEVGRSFLDLPQGVRLPMHRILRIEWDGRTMWVRNPRSDQPKS